MNIKKKVMPTQRTTLLQWRHVFIWVTSESALSALHVIRIAGDWTSKKTSPIYKNVFKVREITAF